MRMCRDEFEESWMSRRVMLIKEYRAHNINHILGSAPWLSKGIKYIEMPLYLDERKDS